jgi:O-antigen/teichoic acid export membrane protein
MLKKLLSHSAIYGLASQIPKLATVLSLPIITKYLTEIDFGVYGLIIAIVAGMSALSDLGLGVVIANTFYKSPSGRGGNYMDF